MSFDLTDPEQLALRAPAYALAFAESMRALDAQDRVAGELTTRAGVLTAAAAVSTSIFGGQALARGQHTIVTWIALVAFLGVWLSVAGLLWPRHGWQFDAMPSRLLAEYVEPEAVPLPVIHRDLVLHRAVSIERNTRQIRRLLVCLRVGTCLLAVEVAAWVASVTGLA